MACKRSALRRHTRNVFRARVYQGIVGGRIGGFFCSSSYSHAFVVISSAIRLSAAMSCACSGRAAVLRGRRILRLTFFMVPLAAPAMARLDALLYHITHNLLLPATPADYFTIGDWDVSYIFATRFLAVKILHMDGLSMAGVNNPVN